MPTLVNNLYGFGEFSLDAQKRILRRAEELVPLTPKAFEILLVLVQSEGREVSKDELMRAVWRDTIVEESNLTQTVFVLRKALGETAEQRYILTLPGRGYRFAIEVKKKVKQSAGVEQPTRELPSVEDSALPSIPRGLILRRWALFLGAAAILIAAVLGAYFRFRASARAQAPSQRVMLAVLPFANLTGDSSQEYFSDGLTEEMTTELGRLNPKRLGIIGRTSVMLYKNNPKSLDQVGRELGVQYVIEGSVRRDADRVRITAQLIQVKDQTHVWAKQYDREPKNLLTLQAEITQEIANEIDLALDDNHKVNGTSRAGVPSTTTSYEAHDFYLKGRYFWNKRTPAGLQQAAEYFQQAIAQDPNYARAYAGLADTYGLMSTWGDVPQNEFMPKARTAAFKALEIDPTLAEAHTSLGLIAETYDYDWQTAEKEFRRAIQLNPDYATAHQWYAEYLSWQGRFDEAVEESERARQLDPLSLIVASDHGAIYYYARQYDRAIAQFRAVLEMDPNFPRAPGLISIAYAEEGRFAEALEILEHWPDDSLSTWAHKAYLYNRRGRTAEARHALTKFERLAIKLRSDQIWPRVIAYAGTERKDEVIALLEKGIAEHSFPVAGIKVDPIYDPLRSDPRFQELLRRLRFAP